MSVIAEPSIRMMPYSMVVGQNNLKLALEISYVVPRIGGVLLSGERGTGKSTLVRAFAVMMDGRLPVTLPINATEDRVVGGWDMSQLLLGNLKRKKGLLEEANNTILYVDEVNLLDDHIVNIILDVASTGKLTVEREGQDEKIDSEFTLVGTMNPSEGGLRPQLLDRFGLMVNVEAEDEGKRLEILNTVLLYDVAHQAEKNLRNAAKLSDVQNSALEELQGRRGVDRKRKEELDQAREKFNSVSISDQLKQLCIDVGLRFDSEGHRGDLVMALAAKAHAALRGESEAQPEDVLTVARLALQHRRHGSLQSGGALWSESDDNLLKEMVLGTN